MVFLQPRDLNLRVAKRVVPCDKQVRKGLDLQFTSASSVVWRKEARTFVAYLCMSPEKTLLEVGRLLEILFVRLLERVETRSQCIVFRQSSGSGDVLVLERLDFAQVAVSGAVNVGFHLGEDHPRLFIFAGQLLNLFSCRISQV